MSEPSVSVIIPTLNASSDIGTLLDRLLSQTLRPMEIVVIDSDSNDDTLDIASSYPTVRTIRIDRAEFNHGLTRHKALLDTSGEFVCFLTQDALPASNEYLRNLIKPMLETDSIALVSGRQLPKEDARPFERLVREFNYPDAPSVRSSSDLQRLGIKTFFSSDSCSAYRRSTYLSCGGFPEVETNEDMLIAAHFIAAGWKVAYEPSAAVYHSHNLSLREQYLRNKAVGRFLENHVDELMGVSEIGEGRKLVKSVVLQLFRQGNVGEIFAFGLDCGARLLGNRAGRDEVANNRRNGNK